MQIRITNQSAFEVPFVVASGLTVNIPPGSFYDLDDSTASVATFGDNPDFLEEFGGMLGALVDTIRSLVARLRRKTQADPSTAAHGVAVVSCVIENQGANALRVLLGDPVKDAKVAPAETFNAAAPGYVEIRELGVGAPAKQVDIEGA